MAGHALIEAHLATLAGRLPAGAVDELADGLTETYQHHLARGLDPNSAAAAAVAEFGDTDQILTAFTHHAPGRRTALALLATGPVFAACWGPSLIMSQAWVWPIPIAAELAFGLALLGIVAILAIAATSQHHYGRTRLAAAGGIGLIVLDAAILAAVLLAAPTLVWPMVLAIPASLARIIFTARSLPRVL
ncbi:MAG TPA: permease prefix domain 1-containing protein [Actinophytocola sp.]|uniref:permease prefix domain 1-containing protein n=1 Tax=Actinophytocola sp. TaxID=1872138 RepID=UPI002DBCD89C|nr:permease prefix domain 1-containing protein [Actinophytocola sp.]HEU5469485.1 permease prefix domain 1-containing protein [Actinophytocola sp.]